MNQTTMGCRDVSNFITSWTTDDAPYVILKWKIENFSLAKTVLTSPCFDVSRTSKWNLILDPNVKINEDVFVGVYLKRNPKCSENLAKVLINGELSVHGPVNELLYDRTFDEIYDQATKNFVDFQIPKILFTRSQSGCCGKDTFLVRCEMILSHEMNTTNEWRPHLEKLSRDIKKLIGNSRFTDIRIRAADDVIHVHKAVLHARSPVLSEILKVSPNFISEGEEESVILTAVLLFAYTGNPDFLLSSVPVEMFGKISVIAKKWELSDLENVLTPVKMECVTRIKYEDFLYTWKIKNFTRLASETMHSSEFITGEENSTKWKLVLEKSSEGNLGLYLVKVNAGTLLHKTDLEFRIYNNKSNTDVIKRREYVFGPRSEQRCGFSSLCNMSFAQTEIVKDDTLYVECKMKFCLNAESWLHFTATSVDISDTDPYSLKYLKALSCNLKELYENQKYNDLKICSHDEVHKVHRAILWARSEYFSNHLIPESVEYITVPIEGDVLKTVLLYIYAAELPQLSIFNAPKLYKASALLKLPELLMVCRFFILQNIRVNNVLEIIIMAQKYGDEELERAAEKFASTRANAKFILNTERWKNFCNKNNILALRIYDNLAWTYCNEL